ncbi:MAG: helix-turn-helix transcriptional regulator [Clostridia bacterium]|nr:helix-turn-helix transcriptional regulator [Clostridia bacterium]
MKDLKLIIADNISDLRKKKGMTQADLAANLSYTDKAVSKWERGESVPDIVVLKAIADLFGVSLDYLVSEYHEKENKIKTYNKTQKNNRVAICIISIFLVLLIATLIFVILDSSISLQASLLTFVYAIPVAIIVWLVFTCMWFNKRRNFVIISLLMWTSVSAIFITLLFCGINVWEIFLLGIPGQAIIVCWSFIKSKVKAGSDYIKSKSSKKEQKSEEIQEEMQP